MSAVHLHLMLNHIPVLGTVFGLFILAYGIARHQDAVMRVAMGLLVVSGVGAAAAYFTGEGAEDVVEGLSGVSEAVVEAHEEIALFALIGSLVVAVLALGALTLYRRRDLPRVVGLVVLVAALGASGVLAYTANLGGQIRHTEIRSADSPSLDVGRRDHDDD